MLSYVTAMHSLTSFNASCRTSNETLLNDYKLIDLKLQRDLATVLMLILLRVYRRYQTTKMYRQILVDSRDIDSQRIV